MARVIHFEIHADEPERAIAFYQTVFGWTITPWGPPGFYWTVVTGPDGTPGINGGLVPRRGQPPVEGQAVNAYVCTINVEHLDDAVAKALAHGGKVALDKMPIPGLGWLGYCKDTEGNIFGLMQNDPSAR